MGSEREVVIETAGGKKVKTTLDAVRSLTARLGEVAPKMREIVSVERKSGKAGTKMVVTYSYVTATSSGHPDDHERVVSSLDPWHPDFRAAWEELAGMLAKEWGPRRWCSRSSCGRAVRAW